MINDTYDYVITQGKTLFAFKSEGVKGSIIKLVLFEITDDGKWNLAFGDLKNGDIDDSVITNNQDAIKVIRTVAKITIEFLEENPLATIKIEPVDEKRKKLYNFTFQRHFKEIEPIFKVIGLINGIKERYTPLKIYDSFEISLKSEL